MIEIKKEKERILLGPKKFLNLKKIRCNEKYCCSCENEIQRKENSCKHFLCNECRNEKKNIKKVTFDQAIKFGHVLKMAVLHYEGTLMKNLAYNGWEWVK